VDVAKCPECGTEIRLTDLSSDQMKLIAVAGALVASAAVSGLMMELPQYQPARPGFDERLREIILRLQDDTEAFSSWGEAFDGEDET